MKISRRPKWLLRLSVIVATCAAVMTSAPAQSFADDASSADAAQAVALAANYSGTLLFSLCGGDGGPKVCTAHSSNSSTCTIIGTTVNPLDVLGCNYNLNLTYSSKCTAGTTYGTGELEYQGTTYIQELTVVQHGTNFTATGETALNGTTAVLVTNIHGTLRCLNTYVNLGNGKFAGTTQYVKRT